MDDRTRAGPIPEGEAAPTVPRSEPGSAARWPYTVRVGIVLTLGLTASSLVAAWSIDRGWSWLAVLAGAIALGVYWWASVLYREWAVGPASSATAGRLVVCSVVGVLACAIGAVVLQLGSDDDSRSLAALGIIVIVVGLMPVMHAIRSEPESDAPRRPASDAVRRWALNIAFAFGALTPGLLIIGAPLIVALGIPTAWLLSVLVNRMSRARWYRRLLVAFAGIGILALAVFLGTDPPGENVPEIVLALLVALGMIDALSAPVRESRKRYPWSPQRESVAVVLGLAAVLVAVVMGQSSLEHTSWRIALLVALGAFAFGGSFIRRGQGLAVLVLLAALTLAVIGDRDDHATLDASPKGTGTIVALGDSYASGEGAARFFPGTNVTGGNNCRRDSDAYGYRVARRYHRHLVFLACSGAIGEQIWRTGQIKGPSDHAVVGWRAQLKNPIPGGTPDLVLISIGGNDALFGAIGRGCALPGRCTDIKEIFDGNLQRVGQLVSTALVQVGNRFPDSPVVIVPYPQMLPTPDNADAATPSAECPGVPLDGAELRYLHGFVEHLDEQVEWAVSDANEHLAHPNLTYLAGAKDAYAGHRVCGRGTTPGVNVLTLAPTEASGLFERLIPTNWMHNNFHPNHTGQELMGATVTDWVGANVPGFGPASALAPTTGVERPDAPTLTERCTGRDACTVAVNEWSTGKTVEAVRSLAIPLLILLALGWFLAAIRRLPLRTPPETPAE